MEMWELFLKGLAKTFEDFVEQMIEKGKLESDHSAERSTKAPADTYRRPAPAATENRKRTIPHKDLGELEGKILKIIGDYPDGITLKEIAGVMGVQWHYLRIPLRQMTLENKIQKDDKLYRLVNNVSESVKAEPVVKPPVIEKEIPFEPVQPKTPEPVVEQKPEPVTDPEPRKNQPRRRVVNAKELERKPQQDDSLPNLSTRDIERLRYRILTALRGRPEGLTLDKLAAVLGMELTVLIPILEKLHGESKVVNDSAGKYRLP